MALISGTVAPTFVRMEVAPISGSTTTLQAPFDFLVFTNPGTIAAQTVVLPASPVDGDMVNISNFAAISTLTVSPAVSGIPAGLGAGQGLSLMYSASLATPGWFVYRS